MRTLRLLSPILIPLFISGCGGGADPQLSAVSKLAASQECIGCHAEALSPGTGLIISEEWQASTHNTGNGAGCADCHDPAPGHPNLCDSCHGGGGKPTGDEVARNPDAAGKCAKCHGLSFPNDVMLRLAPQHFGNMTASALNTRYRASYVSSRYISHCTYCHNPHDTGSAIVKARQWAESPHGDTRAGAYSAYDFKTRGSAPPMSISFEANCVRCHTTTGFLNFVKSGFLDVHTWGRDSDKTKEVTGCDACHDNGAGRSYSYQVRSVPAATIYYNYSSAKTFPTVKLNNSATVYPNAGPSNVCMPCHTGRGIGRMIKDAAALGLNFANANSPGAHYRPAGANLFQVSGYEFDTRSYVNPQFLHSSIGMSNTRGTGSKGPCITCHMSSDNSHLFLPVTLDATQVITGVISTTCVRCHDGSFQPSHSAASLQAGKAGYAAALAVLNLLKTGKSTSTNWDSFSPGNGANTMGASFNYSLLSADPGAFAHNPLYTKRLIYDSIDWINDGILDDDVEAAVNSAALTPNTTTGLVSLSNPITKLAYFPAQAAGSVSATALAQVKSDAIIYLLGSPGGLRP